MVNPLEFQANYYGGKELEVPPKTIIGLEGLNNSHSQKKPEILKTSGLEVFLKKWKTNKC